MNYVLLKYLLHELLRINSFIYCFKSHNPINPKNPSSDYIPKSHLPSHPKNPSSDIQIKQKGLTILVSPF